MRPALVVSAAVTVVLIAAAVWLLLLRDRNSTGTGDSAQGALFDDRQAALPFEALSDEAEVRQLARSIPQEMSVRVAGTGDVLVLAPSTPAGASSLHCEAVRDLGVRWVYHGSVGRFQDRIRVTAQLTSCPGGERLWGETYSREAADLLAGQDEIVAAILASSQQYMNFDYASGTWMQILSRRTAADNAYGMELARQALSTHPHDARVALLQFHLQEILEGWARGPAQRIEEMVKIAEEFLDVAPGARDSHALAGFAYMLAGDRRRMLASFERSVAIAGDTSPATRGWLAQGLVIAGRTEEAIASIDAAVSTSPDDAARWVWEKDRSLALLGLKRYSEARDAARASLSFNINDAFNQRAQAYMALAVSLAYLGEVAEAREALQEAVRLRPELTLSVEAAVFAASEPEHRDHYLEGLRKAGLSERGLLEH